MKRQLRNYCLQCGRYEYPSECGMAAGWPYLAALPGIALLAGVIVLWQVLT